MASNLSRASWINRPGSSVNSMVSASNPARGDLNREENVFALFPFASENLVARRQVRPSRPAPACLFSTLIRLNMVLAHGIPPAIHDGVHMIISNLPSAGITSGQSRGSRVTTQLRTDGVHCRESTGTYLVVLKVVVPVTNAWYCLSGITMD